MTLKGYCFMVVLAVVAGLFGAAIFGLLHEPPKEVSAERFCLLSKDEPFTPHLYPFW